MAVVKVRLHGSLPSHYSKEGKGRGEDIAVKFPQEKVRVKEIFAKLNIPHEAVAFVAINGVKGAKDAWAKEGDKVTIFPFVAGG